LGINDVVAELSLLLTFHENRHTLKAMGIDGDTPRPQRRGKIEGLNLGGIPRAIEGQYIDGFS
jgi:hypothetical protein